MEKKMAFYEAGKGKLGLDVQDDFERAQRIAAERNVAVTINLQMTIYPPDSQDDRFGSVSYQHELKQPAFKSMRYITELKDGKIINSAKNETDLLQMNLEIPEAPNQISFKSEVKNGTAN